VKRTHPLDEQIRNLPGVPHPDHLEKILSAWAARWTGPVHPTQLDRVAWEHFKAGFGRLADDPLIRKSHLVGTMAAELAYYFERARDDQIGITALAALEDEQPSARTLAKRKADLAEFARRGVDARTDKGAKRRVYRDEEKEEWRRLRRVQFQRHSLSQAAALIARRVGLPSSAEKTIKRAIAQELATSPRATTRFRPARQPNT
jgi:hypothetical protein